MVTLNFMSLKRITAFGYENGFVYPVQISDEKFENYMDLLLITGHNILHYFYINDFKIFMCNETKRFSDIVCNVLY